VKQPLTKSNFHAEGIAKTSNRPSAFFGSEHLALDFLNTTATPGECESSYPATGMIWSDWLDQAGAIEASAAARGSGSDRGRDTRPQSVALRAWV
jgi:hypothetical protein